MPTSQHDASDWHNMSTGTWLNSRSSTPSTETARPQGCAFHTDARFADGRPSLLIDPGAVGNLSGGTWVTNLSQLALNHGRTAKQVRRSRPLDVSGVGQGKSTCKFNCTLPIALQRTDGAYSCGTFETPRLRIASCRPFWASTHCDSADASSI